MRAYFLTHFAGPVRVYVSGVFSKSEWNYNSTGGYSTKHYFRLVVVKENQGYKVGDILESPVNDHDVFHSVRWSNRLFKWVYSNPVDFDEVSGKQRAKETHYKYRTAGTCLDTLVGIRKCLCPDGFRRYVRLTGDPDTFFSRPAAVVVRGKTVTGFVSQMTDGDELEFTPNKFGKNYALLAKDFRNGT